MSDISRTETRPEYGGVAQSIIAHLVVGIAGRERTVIGVAGESGSGKSVTATSLARALGEAGHPSIVLHQDDYFVLPPRANHAAREQDIDRVGPGEVNLTLLQAHVAAFRAGRGGVAGPTVDYAADRFDARQVAFAGVRALVVEGTYALGLEDLDARIFLEASYTDTRDLRRTRGRDTDSPFVEQVLAIEHEIIAPQAALADLLINAHFTVRAAR